MGRPVCGIHEALWIARLHLSSAKALYLHIPFCRRKCAYCDFASWETCDGDPLMHDYLAALRNLVAEALDAGLLEGCETAYVGGGTPTMAAGELADLVSVIRDAATGLSELTCEANPDSLTNTLLRSLADSGCTRLSVGVQSTDDGELAELGRLHTASQALERLAAAVATGLDVSADLMCAIPRQTEESWQRSLGEVLDTGVGHVSVYPLQIEEGTPLELRIGDDETPWNDSEVQARRMQSAARMLGKRGLSRYEVASYARPGAACRHNQAYWTAVPYLGIGTSASSMLTREGYQRLRTIAPQLPELEDGIRRVRLTCTSGRQEVARAGGYGELHFDLELLDEGQACAEDLMLAMRMSEGAGPGLIDHARNVFGTAAVDEAFLWCAERDLAYQGNSRMKPTEQGWLLGNELYGRLWELSVGEVSSLSC